MVFVTRRKGESLSSILSSIPNGFYELPRFEVPEGLWEQLDRNEPQEMIERIDTWGDKLHLNHIVTLNEKVLFDGPGDFQLMLRSDLFKIQGFDESMTKRWHIDSNIAKRLWLLRKETLPLVNQVASYHLGHTRHVTQHHGHIRDENCTVKYFEEVSSPYLPQQASRWGAPEYKFEEMNLLKSNRTFLYDWISPILESETFVQREVEYTLRSGNTNLYYDPHHALPYVADNLVTMKEDLTIGYLACSPNMLELVGKLLKVRGSGQILIPESLETIIGLKGSTYPISVCSDKELVGHSDLYFLDFGLHSFSSVNPCEGMTFPNLSLAEIEVVLDFITLQLALIEGERSQIKEGRLPRKFIAIGGFHTCFEPYLKKLIGLASAPYGNVCASGYLAQPVEEELSIIFPQIRSLMYNLGEGLVKFARDTEFNSSLLNKNDIDDFYEDVSPLVRQLERKEDVLTSSDIAPLRRNPLSRLLFNWEIALAALELNTALIDLLSDLRARVCE